MSWARDELKTIELGDARLNKRAMLLAERLAANPTASIPGACGGWAETQAAYRFLAQDDIDWQDILKPHWQSSVQRMQAEPVVLCIQDTTELNFNGQEIQGLGPLSYEAQRGMYVHPTYAITPEREPLGVLDAWMWARELKDADGVRGGVKESTRWVEGYERLAELSADLPETRLVYVADRESDMLALMVKARDLGEPVDWLVRGQHNRNLVGGGKLREHVGAAEVLGSIRFTLPARQNRKARLVTLEIRCRRVAIPDGAGGQVDVTCIVAGESTAGTDRVEWCLLTNRLADTLESATEYLDWYRARWEIEMFFNILKNGCRVEALQLATMERLERALALFMVVSWRIARLMRLGRTCPELDAGLLFEREEWQAAYILNKKRPPDKAPGLNEVIRLTAMLGGFLARKGDGEPGAKTLWIGMQRVADFADGLRYAREYRLT